MNGWRLRFLVVQIGSGKHRPDRRLTPSGPTVGLLHRLDLATAECASCPSVPGFDAERGGRVRSWRGQIGR
jgi:hypothetical protein